MTGEECDAIKTPTCAVMTAGIPRDITFLISRFPSFQFWKLPDMDVITIASELVATAFTGNLPKNTSMGTIIIPPPTPRSPAMIPAKTPPEKNNPICSKFNF